MSRVQLSINVSDFDAAVEFYSRLFGAAPAKLRPGYANFALDDPPLKLVLNSPGNGPGGTINHLGVEVGSVGEVTQVEARLAAAGLPTEPEPGTVAPYIAVEAVRALAVGDRAETSIIGLALTAGTAIFEPALGMAKRRIGARLGSAATVGEGTQNLLCAYLAIAVFAGLAANTLLGAWWLDGVVALGIAGWAVVEGRRAWAGTSCGCACLPGEHC